MGCIQQKLFTPSPPIVITQLPPDPTPLSDPPDIHQLKIDIINVLEGRVDIHTFTEEYQQKIINFYRFSATAYTTLNPVCARRTQNTMDIV